MKILILLLFIIPYTVKSQLYDYKIKVEIDNSDRYRYEEAYYKASADYQNKEIADGLKNKADEYFIHLQRFADFMNEKKLNSKEVEDEFKRLMYFGEDILKLIPLLNSNDLTANKMEYTIKKAVNEFNYSTSNENGNLYKLLKKNILLRELTSMSDQDLEKLIIKKTSESTETLNAYCAKQNQSFTNYTTYRNCLINLLEDIKNSR